MLIVTNGLSEDLRRRLENLRLFFAEKEFANLESNVEFLEEKGLSDLNERLIRQAKRNFLSALTEHNFVVSLLKTNGFIQNYQIKYEPQGVDGSRRPDLYINFNHAEYRVQIKRFSLLKHQNVQNKIYSEIKREICSIKISKFINIQISASFAESDVKPFLSFVREKIDSLDNSNNQYISNGKCKAKFSFMKSNKISHLTIGGFGDVSAVDITGVGRDQIRESLLNAAKAFYKEIGLQGNINLIVAEMGNSSPDEIDLCEALYGTEYYKSGQLSKTFLTFRNNDGLFNNSDFEKKVAGVIAISKKNNKLIDVFSYVLCCNPCQKDYIELVKNLIPIDKVIDGSFLPGGGFFGLNVDRR